MEEKRETEKIESKQVLKEVFYVSLLPQYAQTKQRDNFSVKMNHN